MTNSQFSRASGEDEKRQLLKQMLENGRQQYQYADEEELEEEWEDEEEFEDDEPQPRRSPRKRQPRRKSRARSSSGYETAMISSESVGVLMKWIVRIVSFILMYFSTIGTVGAFTGDVKPLLDNLPFFWQGATRNALLIGLPLQAWVTGFEYWRAPQDFSLRALLDNKLYTFHLGLDIALSVIGYRAIVIPWMQNILVTAAEMPKPGALVSAYVLTVVAAAVLAVLPERVLIER